MEKINQIALEELEILNNSNDKKLIIKEILNLNHLKDYEVGDTAISVSNAKILEVYIKELNGKKYYYIITKVLSEELAMAYSFYPLYN